MDPDPACHFDAHPASHFDPDADPDTTFPFDAGPSGSGSITLLLSMVLSTVPREKSAGSTYQILACGALVPGYPAGQLHVRALGAAPPPARARQPPLHNERAQRAEHIRRLEAGGSLVLGRQALAAAVRAAGASAATAA